jgi:homoserine dehydrogenase
MGSSGIRPARLWVVGFGTVGQWLVRTLERDASELRRRHGVGFRIVGIANRRDGLVYDEEGIDGEDALALAAEGRSLRELRGVSHWENALEGMSATEADLLAEVSASPEAGGEPGFAHLSLALGRGIPAATSNKWPVALRGLELMQLARRASAHLRAEATVMSGTPVLSTLTDGLAGATPKELRGVLNATANFILTEMSRGSSYSEGLAEAQRRGLAEPDPTADTDGRDTLAKLMILSAFVFGRQLRVDDVSVQGISSVSEKAIGEARSAGRATREVASLEAEADGRLVGQIRTVGLPADDPLSFVDGVSNAVICQAEPLGEIQVTGPGAGPALAGQGVLSDLVTLARQLGGRLTRAASPTPS